MATATTLNSIEFRHAERTVLSVPALETVIRYFSDLKYNIIISFDRKIKELAFYTLNDNNKHYIRISTKRTEHKARIPQMYSHIASLLHELCHAKQQEQYGKMFHNSNFWTVGKTSDTQTNYEFCAFEIEARIFSDSNIKKAVKLYEESFKKV